MISWRYFRKFELREAIAHTEAGGVAVHESGQFLMGKSAMHLLAGTKMALMNAAEEIGLNTKYVQVGPRPHFDVCGGPLMWALQKCMEDEAAERKCRVCGCTEAHACPGGCSWVERDLCSSCAGGGL